MLINCDKTERDFLNTNDNQFLVSFKIYKMTGSAAFLAEQCYNPRKRSAALMALHHNHHEDSRCTTDMEV